MKDKILNTNRDVVNGANKSKENCNLISDGHEKSISVLVRDSSVVWRLFSTCCSRGTSESTTYGKQRICPPTLGQHISTFRGYLILFSIINHFLFIHNHLTLRKWCYTPLQHDFPLDPMISSFHIHFGTFVTWLRENYDYRNVSWEMICILTNKQIFVLPIIGAC
jgi:hypothetical protein